MFSFEFETFAFWHWWVLAMVFLGLEMVIPGFFFLWLSVAAGVLGIWILALPDIGWQWQIFLFAIHCVAAVLMWRKFAPIGAPFESDRPNLNQRGASYVGRTFVLEQPITSGRGVVRVDDSRWRIACAQDLPAGARVRVTGWDGTLLKVEPLETDPAPPA